MFCANCNYPLSNLTRRTCPECGTRFDPEDEDTFLAKPRRRWAVPFWWWFAAYWIGWVALSFFNSWNDTYRLGHLDFGAKVTTCLIEGVINGVLRGVVFALPALVLYASVKFVVDKRRRRRARRW